MGSFFESIAAFSSREINRRANILPVTLEPHGSSFADVVDALQHLDDLDDGVVVNKEGEEVYFTDYLGRYLPHRNVLNIAPCNYEDRNCDEAATNAASMILREGGTLRPSARNVAAAARRARRKELKELKKPASAASTCCARLRTCTLVSIHGLPQVRRHTMLRFHLLSFEPTVLHRF